MTKKEFVSKIASKTGVTRSDSEFMLDSIMELLSEQIITDGEFRIASFGTFKVSDVAETTRYNALAGEEKTYPEHKRVRFKPSKEFREKLNAH